MGRNHFGDQKLYPALKGQDMISFNDVHKLAEDMAGPSATTGDAIAFVPAALGGKNAVVQAMAPLAKKKKKWKLSVVNNPLKEQYLFHLEETAIKVHHNQWNDFQGVMKKLGRVTNDGTNHYFQFFSNLLTEAKESTLPQEIEPAIKTLLEEEPCGEVTKSADMWITIFPGKAFTKTNLAIAYPSITLYTKKLVKQIRIAYGSDRGSYEILMRDLQNKRPLKFNEVFEDYEYLYGAVIHSNYNGIGLRFESLIDMNLIPHEKITVHGVSEDALDEIDGFQGCKVSRNVIYPKHKIFMLSFFNRLQKEIKDMEEGS
jgi:hypothetical protein